MRTTIDIDDPILKEIKRLQRLEGKSLGRLVSDLLAQALASSNRTTDQEKGFFWVSGPMGARIDLNDTEALRDAMDSQHS